jgi:thiol-disulfide isomerase/thioredoxin
MQKNFSFNKFSIVIVITILNLLHTTNAIKEWWEDTKAIELNASKFQETVGKSKFVVVKFYTKWCKYCKILAPVYDEFVDFIKSKNLNDTVTIARLEANSNQEIVMMYGIYGFPTVVIFGPNSPRPLSVYEGDRKIEGLWFWVFKHLPQLKRSQRVSKKIATNEVPVEKINSNSINQVKKIVNIEAKNENVIKIEREHIDSEAFNGTLINIRGGNLTNSTESNGLNIRNSTEVKKITDEITRKLESIEKSVVLLDKHIFDLKLEFSGQRELEKEKQKRILLFLIFLVVVFTGICIKCIYSSIRKPKESHYN